MDDPQIVIEKANNFLKIIPTGRSYPDSTIEWDRDAIDLKIIVRTGSFKGAYKTLAYSHEFKYLLTILNKIQDASHDSTKQVFEFREATVKMVFISEPNDNYDGN